MGDPIEYPSGHGLITHFDNVQKGMTARCQCGWEMNGVFSSPQRAKDAWYDHAIKFDKENLAKELKESAAVREQSRKIIDEFTRPYFRKQNGV